MVLNTCSRLGIEVKVTITGSFAGRLFLPNDSFGVNAKRRAVNRLFGYSFSFILFKLASIKGLV